MENTRANTSKLNGKRFRFAIIAARYNEALIDELLKNTQQTLLNHEVLPENIEIVRVPGALELPLMALQLALRTRKKFDALIALGIVIKGETAHFEYVSEHCYGGLMEVSLSKKMPVIFGVLTAYNLRQVQDRTSARRQNKGKEYAEAAIEMAQQLR